MCCLDTLLKTADCEAALSYIQVITVCSHLVLLFSHFYFLYTLFALCILCVAVENIDLKNNKVFYSIIISECHLT